MKKIAYFALSLMALAFTTSCTSDDNNSNTPEEINPIANLKQAEILSNEAGFTLELYTASGQIRKGSNLITTKIAKANQPIAVTNLDWSITMYMKMPDHVMSHGAPLLPLKPLVTQGFHQGLLVPTMPTDGPDNYWILSATATYKGQQISFEKKINVLPPLTERRNIQSFRTDDGGRYTLVLIEPTAPKEGLNTMTAALFSTVDMKTFTLEDGHTIHIDPRMPDPGMDNHTSPNNVDLKQAKPGEFYQGKLSLTMTGYWKINLRVSNPEGTVIKGTSVTPQNESSDIFFELEF